MNRTRKWLILFAGTVLLAASCSKVSTSDNGLALQEISFQVVRYNTATKAETTDNSKIGQYNTSIPFGAYSWYKGVNSVDDTVFMTNQQVGYSATDQIWLPVGTTYYWPKSGSLDFICYSPYTTDGSLAPLPTITENKIQYPLWNITTNPLADILYADKVTGLTNNNTTYYYSGVPTLFHHALAQVTFQIKAAYLEKTAPTGDITRWEIDLNGVQVKDILTAGTLTLNLASDGSKWTLPNPAIWTSDGKTKMNTSLETTGVTALTTTPQTLGTSMLVLPQSLANDQQVVLNVTIRTFRDTGSGFQPVLTETGINIEATLSNGTLPNWCMNQNITYVFILAPSQAIGTGEDSDGDGIEDVDPVSVYFDPAVADWQNITVEAGINL